jgi:hypothetical protein
MVARNVLLTMIIFATPITIRAQESEAVPALSIKILIDSIDNALLKTYIFPEKSKQMAAYLKSQFKQGAYETLTDPKLIASHLERDLRTAHYDSHLRVHYDPGFAERHHPFPASIGMDSAALRWERYNNFSFKRLEVLNGNIGYVEFTAFSGMINEAKATISAAFRFLSNTKAIIIDLRKNSGGSPHMVKHVAAYLVQKQTRLNDIYDRRADKTMEFWADPVEADNAKLSMPVYILTSKQTFSAAEDLAYAMQVNQRAVIVGDTTGGGAHPTGPVYIGQGFVMDIPFARSINHITQTDWEGSGVLPDVPVVAEDALIRAQDEIFALQLAEAATEAQRNQIQWFRHALRARDYDFSLDKNLLSAYVGEYDQFSVTFKDNKLYLHDFIGRTFLMKPITRTLFLAEDWLQLEFISLDGKVVQMKMMGKPGWTNVHTKRQ